MRQGQSNFFFREPALRADRRYNRFRRPCELQRVLGSLPWMGQPAGRRQGGADAVVRPGGQGFHPHQDVATTLFTCLDDVTLKTVEFGLSRMDHAAGSLERDEDGDTEFREFLDKELGAVPFGQWGGHFQGSGSLALGSGNLGNLDLHFPLAYRGDGSVVFATVAVE